MNSRILSVGAKVPIRLEINRALSLTKNGNLTFHDQNPPSLDLQSVVFDLGSPDRRNNRYSSRETITKGIQNETFCESGETRMDSS